MVAENNRTVRIKVAGGGRSQLVVALPPAHESHDLAVCRGAEVAAGSGVKPLQNARRTPRCISPVIRIVGPPFRGPQQATGKRLAVIQFLEEAPVLGAGKLPGELGVDDRIEGDVLGQRRATGEPGVGKKHVPQLVHDQQEQVLIVGAVSGDELGVHQQPAGRTCCHGRRRHFGCFADFHQLEKRLEFECGPRDARGQTFPEIACLRQIRGGHCSVSFRSSCTDCVD